MSFEGFFQRYSIWIISIIILLVFGMIILMLVKGYFSTETQYIINMTNMSNETMRLITKL